MTDCKWVSTSATMIQKWQHIFPVVLKTCCPRCSLRSFPCVLCSISSSMAVWCPQLQCSVSTAVIICSQCLSTPVQTVLLLTRSWWVSSVLG